MRLSFAVLALPAYAFASAFTRPLGGGEFGGGADRIVMADFLALALIGYSVVLGISKSRFYFPALYQVFLLLLGAFILSATFALYPGTALFEVLVIGFGFATSIALLNILLSLSQEDFSRSLYTYVLTMGALAAFLIVDYFFFNMFNAKPGGLAGSFRNTGQAGAFLGVHIAIVFCLLMSRLVPTHTLTSLALIVLLLAIVLTVKRSAMIGLFGGLFFYLLFMLVSRYRGDKVRGVIMFGLLLLMIPLSVTLFNFALETVEGLAWRFQAKVNTNTLGDFASGFLNENIQATIHALELRPLLGVGLGNVAGIITEKYEIHSTYLALLATSGIVGAGIYALFMGGFLASLLRARRFASNHYAQFVVFCLPMLLGLMISWSYTLHLRKREFWTLMAVTVAITIIGQRLHKYTTAQRQF
ncbi:MAG: O-antigen ligase family protein [Pseudomonadota bacterium]